MQREVKSARDLRVLIAEYDMSMGDFADRTGISPKFLSHMLHGRARITEPFRIKIEAVANELADNPPPPVEAPVRPGRGEVKLSQL